MEVVKVWLPLFGAIAMIILAILVSLKCDSEKLQNVIFWSLLLVVLSGLVFYGGGLSTPEDSPGKLLINTFKTVAYTISMFGGGEKYDALMAVNDWFAENVLWQILYWLIHLLAMFVTASAVMITWGKKLLSFIKMKIPGRNLCILYCDSDRRIDYVAQLEEKGYRTIYVGDFSKELSNRLADYKVRIVSDQKIGNDGEWLRKFLRFYRKQLNIQVISDVTNDMKAVVFLKTLFETFRNQKISTKNIKIQIVGKNVMNYAFVSDEKDHEGYRFITVVSTESEMVARKLVDKMPPYQTMQFDYDTCRGLNDFNVMIIGFGQVGQDVLRQLVRNGQFLQSRFSAEVFDIDTENCGGLFRELYSEMISRYDISFYSINAFSSQIYRHFKTDRRMNYIVACTGDDETNRQITNELQVFRQLHREYFSEKSVIACCSKKRIEFLSENERLNSMKSFDISDFIEEKTDMLARHINDAYYLNERGYTQQELRELWYRKDPVDRLSSAAAAEYLKTYFTCSNSWGLNRKQLEEKIETSLKNILPELEHDRWNAFESSIGVSQMSKEEFADNVRKCRELVRKASDTQSEEDTAAAEKQFAVTRKNLGPYGLGGKHACLCSWNELDERWNIYAPLLKEYNQLMEVLGKRSVSTLDFKSLDVKNIYHMLDLLDE